MPLLPICLSALTSEGKPAPLLLACHLFISAAWKEGGGEEEEEEEGLSGMLTLESSSEAGCAESSACEPVPDVPCTAAMML